jgi:hypothetical protein
MSVTLYMLRMGCRIHFRHPYLYAFEPDAIV